MKVSAISTEIGALGTIPKMFGKGTLLVPLFGNQGTSGGHLVYIINTIGKNTEKSPGDLMRLADTSVSSAGKKNS